MFFRKLGGDLLHQDKYISQKREKYEIHETEYPHKREKGIPKVMLKGDFKLEGRTGDQFIKIREIQDSGEIFLRNKIYRIPKTLELTEKRFA